MARRSLVLRLLAAFLTVSQLPIGALAYRSWRESREAGGVTPAAAEEREAQGEEAGRDAHGQSGEELFGLPIATIELGVAGVSLVLSVGMALYIGRTLIRPIRELEGAMSRVEQGDLDAKARVASNDEIGRLAASFNAMVDGLRREAFIRDLFGQYVTPELAAAAIERRGRLDGQLVTSTVLFADIRDFTGISEALPASELIGMLNRYFDRMARVIVDAGGLVNKFGGDSLLAIFGSPLNPAEDHAARAVGAALALEEALAEFNREQRERFLPEIMIGIGVASGDVVAGNVGSATKLEYTLIGDAVNVASRLQTLTKELGETMLFTAETARLAGGPRRFVPVADLEVRGKARSVRVLRLERQRDRESVRSDAP